jgi:hypothetical protein
MQGTVMNRLAIIATALLLSSGAALTQPNPAAYQLQERCGKRAEEVLRSSGWDPAKEIASIQSHYNSHLNRCTAIQRTLIDGAPDWVLFDVNEGKDYGEFSEAFVKYKGELTKPVTACYVEDKHCRSQQEWEELARPYMEE